MQGECCWCAKRSYVCPTDCTIAQCGSTNCKTCKILITDNSFSSNFTKRSFTTHSFDNLSCKSTNLVYGIECGLCGLMYIGETKGQLRSRVNGHRFQINHGGNQLLYRHFNLPDHSILSMKVRILEKIYHPTNNPSLSTPFRRKPGRTLDTTAGNCCSIWLQWSHWQHRESNQSWVPVGKCFESVWQNQQETSKPWLEKI